MEQTMLSPVQRKLIERLRGAAGGPVVAPPGIEPPERTTEDADAPLSFAQERVWQAQADRPSSSFLNLVLAGELLDVAESDVEDRINLLVRRQDALRSVFPAADGHAVQRTVPYTRVTVPRVDLAAAADPEAAWDALVAQYRDAPFDPLTGPLYRVVLARRDERRLRLLFVLHHLVVDGFSISLISAQLTSPVDAALPLRYADFARWQRGQAGTARWDRELDFWRGHLADRPDPVVLPTDRPRPARPDAAGEFHHHILAPGLAARVREVAGRLKTTPFTVLLAAFSAFVHRSTGERDIMLGSTVLGRTEPQLRDLVGYLANMVALRVPVRPAASFADLVGAAREAVSLAMSHQDLPYEEVNAGLRPPATGDRPLFRLLFNMPGMLPDTLDRRISLPGMGAGSMHDVHLMILPSADSFELFWNYRVELYDKSTIHRYAEEYVALIDAATGDPAAALSEWTGTDARA